VDKQVVQRFRACFDVYLLYIALAMLVIGWHDTHTQVEWMLGDWLINYQGGFVRRGLMGELVLHSSRLTHVSPLYVAAAMGILFYAVIWLSVREILFRSSWSLWTLFVVFSPATLAFGILDDRGGFHKEIIFLAGLGLLLVLLDRIEVSDLFLSAYLTITCAVCILSHEALFVYMAYYLAAVVIGRPGWRRVLSIAAVPFLVGAACFYATTQHPGNQDIVEQICLSLKDLGPVMHDGAIGYLSHDSRFAREELLTDMHLYHYLNRYPLLAILSLLPILWGFCSLWKQEQLRKNLRIIGGLSLLSMLGSTMLFLYATDWGRWIYIHIFSLSLLFLFLSSRATNQSYDFAQMLIWPQREYRAKAWGMFFLLLLYSGAWNLPCFGDHPAHGYWNIVIHLMPYLKHHPPVTAS
jgi:hypothetical protein